MRASTYPQEVRAVLGDDPTSRVELSDGRVLSYAEYGDPGGRPVLFFHGSPGSRVEGSLLASQAAAHGLRLIAPDRPGMGGSDFQPERSFLDWPNDVTELADFLGLERFAVLGVSGGGPYVIACAHAISERLVAAVIVAGPAPMTSHDATRGMSSQSRRIFAIARRAPWFVRVIFGLTALTVRWLPDSVLARLSAHAPPPDRAVLMQRPDVGRTILASLREALRNGGRGVAFEMNLYTRPWCFALEDVRSRIELWQGSEDTNVPARMAEHLARHLPGCVAHIIPGEGHFSLLANHHQQILNSLAC